MIEAVLREHLYKPIAGDVLLIGRQTTYLSPTGLLDLLREFGVTVHADPGTLELDRTTINPKHTNVGNLVSDKVLFQLLGARTVNALDHSSYEGAEVIHDLRAQLPTSLHGVTDFLVDGSTLDNVFTPSTVLQNYAKLLRSGGRLLMINAFSPHNTAYAMMPPLWYVDYFVMNRFTDCKVYVLLFVEDDYKKIVDNVFWVDLDHLSEARVKMGRFVSPHEMVTVVFAEKGENSTVDRLPIQQDYRSEKDWAEYLENLSWIRKAKRHHLVRSRGEIVVAPTVSGHRYIDRNFSP
jgi:hypothetical protein